MTEQLTPEVQAVIAGVVASGIIWAYRKVRKQTNPDELGKAKVVIAAIVLSFLGAVVANHGEMPKPADFLWSWVLAYAASQATYGGTKSVAHLVRAAGEELSRPKPE